MRQGFVKIHRKIWEHPRASDPEFMSVWLWMICEAQYTDKEAIFEGKTITLKAGQFTAGRNQIAEATGTTPKKVRKVIEWLKDSNLIYIKSSNKCSLFSILNWNVYQNGANEGPALSDTFEENISKWGQQNGQQKVTEKHLESSEFLVDLGKGANKRANKGPTRGQQGATTEEGKEGKEEKNVKKKEKSTPKKENHEGMESFYKKLRDTIKDKDPELRRNLKKSQVQRAYNFILKEGYDQEKMVEMYKSINTSDKFCYGFKIETIKDHYEDFIEEHEEVKVNDKEREELIRRSIEKYEAKLKAEQEAEQQQEAQA